MAHDNVSFHRRYLTREKLNSGTWGTVFLASRLKRENGEEEEEDGFVVVKMVDKKLVHKRVVLDGYVAIKEIALLKRASQVPGVVRIINWYETLRHFAIVMEYHEGYEDLFDYLKKIEKMEEARARTLFRQLLTIVMGCHEAGVFHRDLKPENVLYNPETEDVKLIDFGCGRFLKEDKDAEYRKKTGTESFAPPEYFTTGRYRAESFTVWSLGMFLYELVFGGSPHEDTSQIVSAEIEYPDDEITPPLKKFLKRCLKKNANKRATLEELALDPWLATHS